MRLTSLVAAILALAILPAAAQQEETGIVVRGQGRVEAPPDMATLTLGVTAEAGTAGEAMARNGAAMAPVLQRLRDAGIAERDIQTSGLTLSPRYGARSPEEAPRITGYVAQNVVTVRVRALGILGDVLDAVVSDGANTMGGLRFGVQEPEALEAEARRRAVADARRKAGEMAEAADVTLGQVRALVEEGGGGGPTMMLEARMADAAVPVAEGEVTFESSVRMVFEIDR